MGGQPEAVRLLVHRPGAVLPLGRRGSAGPARAAARAAGAGGQARRRRRGPRGAGNGQRQDAHLPRPRVPRHGIPAGGDRAAGAYPPERGEVMNQLCAQLVNLLGAVLLLLAFAMISQRRILSLIHLYTLQGLTLVAS